MSSTEWSAICRRQAPAWYRLPVLGVVTVSGPGFAATLCPASSQLAGDDYQLRLVLRALDNPGPFVLTVVPVVYEEQLSRIYATVSVLPDGPELLPIELV